MSGRSSKVIQILQSTLTQLEQDADLQGNDRALRELRSHVAYTIAELELRPDKSVAELMPSDNESLSKAS